MYEHNPKKRNTVNISALLVREKALGEVEM